MYKILILLLLVYKISLSAYTNKDWEIYNDCKEVISKTVYGGYREHSHYSICKEVLSHKSALKKYGAEASYKYWCKRMENEMFFSPGPYCD